MAPSQNQAMYHKDEKALCFHHELLYEAKVIDVKQADPSVKKSGWLYRVHYKGWKNTWDDWVPQDRLRKMTEENKGLANNLRKDVEASNKRNAKVAAIQKKRGTDSSARGSEERHSSVAAGSARNQKRRDLDLEKEDQYHSKPAIRIYMPDSLKILLVDDWESVTKDNHLVSLPSATPASIIIDRYFQYESRKRPNPSADLDLLEEVIQGLKEYFNKTLGRMLLYRFERQQYLDIIKRVENPTDELAGRPMVDIYGGEHLLRLLVSLPELVAHTNMDQPSVARLREELNKLTMWLGRPETIQKHFSVAYEPMSIDEVEKIRT
ncbi:mortality factor 4-like protein-like protein 1 [Eremomyces bilateralis CBS 781.70]|uniref:Chromatin modification-related protein EAF3 n=1 Tax=Eremomyces bilateralis CBS 781.70 TaxID=1392243 RepID=A0A6G1FTT7_9PEZI|nr:mortality factor 4-like protein-like protein 1 [Eremomyces bilateralis CBS 781.70]KAF1809102.1 mortality factor 4-like protein-like protein 1 [Eremomyces bilateralis CBS 781.70]